MHEVKAADILRHQPPFRFIGICRLNGLDSLTASVPALPPHAAWAAPLGLSALPVEYAAQAMGVLIRSRRDTPRSKGVLAGVSEFIWTEAPAELAEVNVLYAGSRGAFHDFDARFTGLDGRLCATASGFVHLAPEAAEDGQSGTAPAGDLRDVPIFEISGRHSAGDEIFATLRSCAAAPIAPFTAVIFRALRSRLAC